MPAVTIERSSDEAILTMAWHDMFVTWLQGPLTVANQREGEQHIRDCIEQWPRGIGLMVVIDETTPPLSNEARRELDATYHRLGPSLRGASYVILGSSLNTMMVRGALTASNWVTRRPFPSSTSSDLKKGATWLHYTLGEDPERGSVDEFIQALAAAASGEDPQTLRIKRK